MLEKHFWKSKKFWAMVVAVALNLLQHFGVEGMREVSYPIMVYLIGQGVADIGKSKPAA